MAASVAAAALGGKAPGGALGGFAASMFKPKDVAKQLASAVVGQAAKSAAQSVGIEKKIEWDKYNWPLKHEWGALIHFDLVELRERRDAGVFNMINMFYAWWRFTMLTLAVNAVSTIVLLSVAQPAYSGVSVLTAIVWALLCGVSGMALVYKAYHGWAEESRTSQLIARALVIITVTLALIQAFGAFGNINGWAGFASGRFKEAAAQGVSTGAIQFWQAATVLESCAWLGNIGIQMWMTYRMLVGPAKVELAAQGAQHA